MKSTIMQIPYCADIWLGGYVRDRLSRFAKFSSYRPVRAWVAITDHYEPFWHQCDRDQARARVAEWRRQWPAIAERHCDSRGIPPQYCFFYPEEQYQPELLDSLAEIKQAGYGDVEIHLHHDGEGEANFLERMDRFKRVLFDRHGLLRKKDGQIIFGFIHGNWALDNSRPDGRDCGLNNEIQLLRDLGCYADFTMPCGPTPMQSRMLNKIFWATDDPDRPKSYDAGTPVIPGHQGTGDLLMISGPFGLRWRGRWKPRFEIGELAAHDPPTPYRIERWLDLAPRVGGDIFIKLFCHGTQESNMRSLLGGGLDLLFSELTRQSGKRGLELCYVTAWQMRQAVSAAAERRMEAAA